MPLRSVVKGGFFLGKKPLSDVLSGYIYSGSAVGAFSILTSRGFSLFASLRYVWNATRGHRLAPWRSEYLRWRVETYSGQRAETLTASSMLRFVWSMRGELLRFLVWAGRLKREARKTGTRERGIGNRDQD